MRDGGIKCGGYAYRTSRVKRLVIGGRDVRYVDVEWSGVWSASLEIQPPMFEMGEKEVGVAWRPLAAPSTCTARFARLLQTHDSSCGAMRPP